MQPELRTALERGAIGPYGDPDVHRAWQRGRRLHRRRLGAWLVAVVVSAAGLSLASFAVIGHSGHTPRVVTQPAAEPTPYHDPTNGVSVAIPDGWHRADRPLRPTLTQPREILSIGSYPLAATTDESACEAQLPKSAIDGLGPHDIFLWIVEANTAGRLPVPQNPTPNQFPSRPADFATTKFTTFDCNSASHQNATFRDLYFTDAQRVIGVYIATGASVSRTRQAEAWQVLNSLRFDAPGGQPPST